MEGSDLNLENRIAVCISGQVRTGVYTINNILKFFSNPAEVDFFIHTWDEDTTLPYSLDTGFLSYEHSEGSRVDYRNITYLRTKYKPIAMKVDNLTEYEKRYFAKIRKETGGETPAMHAGMFNSIYEANKLKIEYEEKCNSKYKAVVKCRFDILFDPNESLLNQLHFMNVRDSMFGESNAIYTLDFMNKLPHRVEDVVLVGSSSAMDIFADYLKWRETDMTKTQIDWQIRLAEYLNLNGIEVRHWMNNKLFIYRPEHVDADIKINNVWNLR